MWASKRTVQMSSGNLTARGINFNTNEQCTRRPAADGSDSLLFYVLFFFFSPRACLTGDLRLVLCAANSPRSEPARRPGEALPCSAHE